MILYVLRRLLWIVLTMLAVSMLTFGLIFATGDPAVLLVPTRQGEAPDPELVERVRKSHGLDKPIPVQYLTYLNRLVRGDMGYSTYLRRPTREVLLEKFPNTALLAALIVVTSLAIGLPMGLVSAIRRNGPLDRAITVFNTVSIAVPAFLLALVLVYVVAFRWHLLPFGGSGSPRH